ncbi:MAG: hypothetical protein NC904_04270 [Candidatus Omnitrophica bacterium]|nr:hypothetical protein [Candidatus Omnitrophota bacterium]
MDEELIGYIRSKFEEILRMKGIDLVDFKVFSQGRRWTIRSIVDYPYGGITVDECSSLNQILFSLVEKEKILGDDFVVEVNSPGLDRPLVTAKDFLRAKGKIICVWFREPIKGKDYRELVVGDVKDDGLFLGDEEGFFFVPFEKIKMAKQKVVL